MRNGAIVLGIIFALIGGNSAPAAHVQFQSDWANEPDRIWAGKEFWTNPLQDWRIQSGRLECIQGGADRNVHLLTWQVKPQSTLTMRVTVGKLTGTVAGWAGFRFASHGLIDEYRHNCIWGDGINAGIRDDGTLFIGNQSTSAAFTGEVTLQLELVPNGANHDATLSTLDSGGIPITSVSKSFSSDQITGNVLLVCDTDDTTREGKFYFKNWNVEGDNLSGGTDQNWGPILWAEYTLSRGVMKMTAQMVPLGASDSPTVRLETHNGVTWTQIATSSIDALSRTATFRVADWDDTQDTPYRLGYTLKHTGGDEVFTFEGTIRRDPVDKETIVVAGFTGNKDYGFPNREIVNNVGIHDPDVLFFSGDQIYESVGGYGRKRTPLDIATLDYLRKWYLFGWSFGDLMRDRPTVSIPDDHDVYHGNLWGAGGRSTTDMKDGGYVMNPAWVNMVQRTQSSHLPDPFDPTPVEQDITVYYTDMVYGRISFAIIEDRKFKSGPNEYPEGSDSNTAVLLGERQLNFIGQWAADWRGCDMKATLTQTVFAQCHTHGGKEDVPIVKDPDANGWPPEGRDRALCEIRRGFAFMIGGDNHLPTIVHHGIDRWRDAGYSFTVPSIAAGFPRKWEPEEPGLNRLPGYPDYTGDFISDHGHHITFWAAANPDQWVSGGGTTSGDIQLLDDKSSGYGIVRFDKNTRNITIECWRILADLGNPEQGQFDGWPLTIDQEDNYGRAAAAWLPEITIDHMDDPVFQVIDETTGEIVYTLRIKGNSYRAKVFHPGTYTVRVGEQPDQMTEYTGILAETITTTPVFMEWDKFF